MTALKCPNPSCPYLFDPSLVPPGVVLSCPRCGFRFTLGPPADSNLPVNMPANMPASPWPASAHVPGAGFSGVATAPGYSNPLTHEARSLPPPAATGNQPATPPILRSRPQLPVRSSRLQTFLLGFVGLLAFGAAGVVVWYKLTHKPAPPPVDSVVLFKDLNLSIEPPPSPWIRDEDMKARLGSPFRLVYRRDNPEAFVAIGAQDFDPRSPRAGELRSGLTQALGRLLEAGTLREFEPQETTWMGQEISGFKFTGRLTDGATIEGEAYAIRHKGFGYWFLAWTGENEIYEEQKGAFAEARGRCKLLDLRRDWKERQSSVVSFKNNVLGYTLLDAEGIWQEESNDQLVKGEDPRADKLLRARIKRKGEDFGEEATLVVLILDEVGDPLPTARAYIERQANANVELFGKTTFTESTERLEGDPLPDAVSENAPVVLLRSVKDRDPTQSRLWVISAIAVKTPMGEKIVAVCGRCLWRERASFDTRLVQIAKSLRAGD